MASIEQPTHREHRPAGYDEDRPAPNRPYEPPTIQRVANVIKDAQGWFGWGHDKHSQIWMS